MEIDGKSYVPKDYQNSVFVKHAGRETVRNITLIITNGKKCGIRSSIGKKQQWCTCSCDGTHGNTIDNAPFTVHEPTTEFTADGGSR